MMEADRKKYEVSRSDCTVLAAQLEGIEHGMLVLLQIQKSFGPELKQLARNAEEYFLAITKGHCVDNWPPICDKTTDADMFALICTMLSTTKAFLTPEQLEAHSKSIGFHAENRK